MKYSFVLGQHDFLGSEMLKLFAHRVIGWRDRVVVDAFSAAAEAILALFFSSLSVLVLVMMYGLRTSGANAVEAIEATIEQYFEPADALQYLTAILSSTTAYTLFRLYGVRDHISRVVIVILITVLLWFGATPLFLVREPPNEEFADNLAITLVSAGLAVWWFLLFSQRRIFERTPRGSRDDGVQKIANKLESYR